MRERPPFAIALVFLALVSAACSVLNRVDACERVGGADFTVNARVDNDQITSSSRSVTRLSNGLYAATWISTVDADIRSPSEVRVGLFTADGRQVPSCRSSLSERSLTGADEVAFRPAIAASDAPNSPVYVVWQSRAREADPLAGPYRVRAAILDVDLCALDNGRQDVPVLELSDDTFVRNFAPSIAVRADGTEALAVWIGQRDEGSAILARPLGVSTNPLGRVENNACDASPRPCELTPVRQPGRPIVAAVRSGYVAAWSGLANDGSSRTFAVSWQRFDPSARRLANGTLPERLEDLGSVFLSLTADRDGWAIGYSALQSDSLAAQRDSDVWLRRFDASDAPRGPAARINDRVEGVQAELSIAALGDGAVFAAWTDRGADGRGSEVRAITLGADDRPLFNGAACDTGSFVLSGLPAARRRLPSVWAAGDELLALYSDNSGLDPDRFGESVRARRFSISRLLLRPATTTR
ncbi:MAG: hypothetical protein JNK05_16780 [Myxococcales bacterium]|nr:hypothetical protein [Myxococcales bacterium]